MRTIILLGAPGSGKSTQGQLLADYLGCAWVSTGELFRKSNDARIQEILKTSALMSDEVTFDTLKGELSRLEAEGETSVVIDGFPRTVRQAQMALELSVSEVIEIEVPEEELMKRLLARGREQDSKEVAMERAQDYLTIRTEVMNVLHQAGIKISKVDGVGSVEEVFNKIKEVL